MCVAYTKNVCALKRIELPNYTSCSFVRLLSYSLRLEPKVHMLRFIHLHMDQPAAGLVVLVVVGTGRGEMNATSNGDCCTIRRDVHQGLVRM